MTPGQEVRLKNAYIVKCTGCKKDEEGNIIEVYAEYDPDTKTGMPGSSRKVKGTLHWVSCAHCLKAEVRLYDRLWKVENPRDEMAAIREAKKCDALEAMKEMINPDSLHVLTECYVEKYLAEAKPLDYLQFQRIGYFNHLLRLPDPARGTAYPKGSGTAWSDLQIHLPGHHRRQRADVQQG